MPSSKKSSKKDKKNKKARQNKKDIVSSDINKGKSERQTLEIITPGKSPGKSPGKIQELEKSSNQKKKYC